MMKNWFAFFIALFVFAYPAYQAAAQDAKGGGASEEDIVIEEDEAKSDAKTDKTDVDADADVEAELEGENKSAKDKEDTPPSTGATSGKSVSGSAKDKDSRTYWQDIKVVPRKLILKQQRVELIPYVGITLNDNLIRHYLVGGEFAYYMSDAMSFGVGAHAYLKQQTDRAYLTGLQQRALPTLNKYLYSATLNVNYEAAYGKMAVHNKKILQWGVFFTGGFGVTGTEVIPRSAAHEPWQNTNITIQIGVGFRVFVSKWLTMWTGVRNYMMMDKFENSSRDDTQASAADGEAKAASRFINNIVFQVGLSVFFPTDFQYTTFK